MLQRLLDYALEKEPALAVATLVNAVGSLAALVALWGLSVSDSTQTAIIATISTLVPVIYGVAIFIRKLVAPVPKVQAAIVNALASPMPEANETTEQVKARAANILKLATVTT